MTEKPYTAKEAADETDKMFDTWKNDDKSEKLSNSANSSGKSINTFIDHGETLLSVQDLVTYFFTEEGIVRAVEGVSFEIKQNEVLGLVGETGCGKSVTALSVIRLVRQPGKIISGHVLFKGEDLLAKTESEMRHIRGNDVTMIFQDPMNSLNPVYSVERQLNEVFLLHQRAELAAMKARDVANWQNTSLEEKAAKERKINELTISLKQMKQEARVLNVAMKKYRDAPANEEDVQSKKETFKNIEAEIYRIKLELQQARAEKSNPKRRKLEYYATKLSIKALKDVKIHTPEKVIKSYPHELSGGMRQRVMIAMGLACNPALLIADEPTTALDVTIQAQILELMRHLKKTFKTSILLITHDLGTIAEMCDRVAVMYSGRIVEYGNVYDLFKDPKHPYTRGLMNSIPDISKNTARLPIIPGTVPNLRYPPAGCRFHPRCKNRMVICDKVLPPLFEVASNYQVGCFLYAKKGVQEYDESMFAPYNPVHAKK